MTAVLSWDEVVDQLPGRDDVEFQRYRAMCMDKYMLGPQHRVVVYYLLWNLWGMRDELLPAGWGGATASAVWVDELDPQQRALPKPSKTPPMWADNPTQQRRARKTRNHRRVK